MKRHFSLIFVLCGLLALLLGALAGVLISLVYITPDFMKDIIPFNQLRPMHTTFVVSWIIMTAVGGIYFYMQRLEKLKNFSERLGVAHLLIFLIVAIIIPFSILSDDMAGREYLEFTPFLILPILVGWALFGINYYKTVLRTARNWPAYYWMWGLGILFMIFHLSESNFWVFKHFREDYIRDITVQWKSYGSFVGSWNLLVYGTAIYLMSKVKDDINLARGKTTFFFLFLGLGNLMFNWAHHTYIIPTQPWVRYAAYVVSMTEWIIFIKIVYSWTRSLNKNDKQKYSMTYRYIIASDVWVFLNLFMALLMSIPALNFYSHGTHITVAHSMGTTIGINTSILLASVSFIVSKLYKEQSGAKLAKIGFYLFNGSLLVFWVALIVMGVTKIYWQQSGAPYAELHANSHTIYLVFIVAGFALFTSIVLIAVPMIKKIFPYCYRSTLSQNMNDEIELVEESTD